MDSSKDGAWRFVPFFGGGGSESGVSSEAFDMLSAEVDVKAGFFYYMKLDYLRMKALRKIQRRGGGEGVKKDLPSDEDSTSAEDDNV